ncbi:Appr-1-p processing protein [Chloroflexia bacterium SDU3-3]|nr:Appr-1-p processing protein [Chloroflexia bacterium SDU3-3]
MITFASGDLLQAEASYIAQGVAIGSQEGLGTGLALKISTRWPDAQQQFKRHTRSASFGGGDMCVIPPTAERPGIIYIATQPDMYHATLPFLNRGLRNLAKHCAKRGIPSVALPKIGAGLGKLDWQTQVRPLMLQHLASGATQFIIYEDFRLEHERGE